MATFRKKPEEIEAFKFDGDFMNSKGRYYVPDWAVVEYQAGMLYFVGPELYVKTRNGDHHVLAGDYIIRKETGEMYICKPYVFEKKYEAVL